MANNQRRMIYAKIWTSEQFGKLSDKAKLLFIGCVTLADDDGRLRGNPAYLRGQIFPYEGSISVTEVLQLRNEIEKCGLIGLYSVDNYEYIQHPKWEEYQKIRKDLYKESSLPFRNETVTKPLRKRALSQVKLSQVKLSKDKISQLAETSSAKEFSLKEEIKKLEDNPRRDLNIIALYLSWRNPDLKSYAQFQTAVKRHLKSAKLLEPFDDNQIIKAFEKSKDQTREWTIETAIKNAVK